MAHPPAFRARSFDDIHETTDCCVTCKTNWNRASSLGRIPGFGVFSDGWSRTDGNQEPSTRRGRLSRSNRCHAPLVSVNSAAKIGLSHHAALHRSLATAESSHGDWLSLGCVKDCMHVAIPRSRMRLATLLALTVLSAAPAAAQSAADSAAVRAAALDYIEGWYEGNADRMARAVHPELAKRIVQTNPQG